MYLDYSVSQQDIDNVKRPHQRHGLLGTLLFEFHRSGKPIAKLQGTKSKPSTYAGYVRQVIKDNNLPLTAICRSDIVYIINKNLTEDI